MRIANIDDLNKLGSNAKRQIEAAIKAQGGFNPKPKLKGSSDSIHQPQCAKTNSSAKKTKPARVMKTADKLSYCPWPSTDPFVKIHQALESKYGMYENGGALVTEMIIEGGDKNWRFDFAIISPSIEVCTTNMKSGINETVSIGGAHLLIEADGFGFHRSKDAFKNDRVKQTHALKQGFLVQRVTNEDARKRIDSIMDDIEHILSHQRIYKNKYSITPKGKTQSLFCWI